MFRRAFTLIELLVVIAIVAVLAIVVILTLNPAQLLMQARDSNRISDLASIQTALGVFQADQPGGSLGASNTVYPSIADSVATSTAGDQCQGLGLPTLPATFAYRCAATSTYRANTNTGWIPVNFASISVGSPLSQLPIDPANSSSSRLYYTYTTNGSQFELTAAMESAKYKLGGSNDAVGGDGGMLATVYEKGSRLGLQPLDYGDSALVGLWTFDEGTGTVAYDYSGSNATGSWSGTPAGTSGYYSAGKIGSWAGYFSSNAVDVKPSSTPNITGSAITLSAWINSGNVTSNYNTILAKNYQYLLGFYGSNGTIRLSAASTLAGNTVLNTNTWYFVAGVYDGSKMRLYLNGVQDASTTATGNLVANGYDLIFGTQQNDCVPTPSCINTNYYYAGYVDDIRIYNRALSATEIQALYNAQK